MLLIGVTKENNWLMSRWHLTYRVSWEQLLKGLERAYPFYEQPQVLVGNQEIGVSDSTEIASIAEGTSLTFRGMSKIFGLPLSITLYYQVPDVDVSIAAVGEEFRLADYEKFNKSISNYLTSIEIAMFQ